MNSNSAEHLYCKIQIEYFPSMSQINKKSDQQLVSVKRMDKFI